MKNLFYSLFIICFCTTFFACSGDVSVKDIPLAEPYALKSGKMVNRFADAIRNMEIEDSLRTAFDDEILFVGSSSIRLWKSLVVDMLPMHAINRGFGGSTIPELTYYANRIVIPYQPKLIVFYSGENDISDGYTPQEVFNSFKQFDEIVHQALPETQLLYISMKPSLDRWELWDQFKEGNLLIKKYIESNPHLHYFDSSASMLTAEGTPDSTIFIDDGLHMNEAGYSKWTAQLKPLIESLSGFSEATPNN